MHSIWTIFFLFNFSTFSSDFLAFGLASVDDHLNANIFFLLKPLLFRSLFLISVHVLDSLFLLFFHRKFTAHRIRKLPTTTIYNGTTTRTNTKIYLCPHTQQPQNNALIRSRSCRRFFPTFHFSISNFFLSRMCPLNHFLCRSIHIWAPHKWESE